MKPKKIIFDHLPKCGGSTLISFLKEQYSHEKTFENNKEKSIQEFKSFVQAKRHNFDLIVGHLVDELFDYIAPECIKTTLLREPVDRIISHYYFAKENKSHYLNSAIIDNNMSLEEYSTSGLSGELQNWYTLHFSGFTLSQLKENPNLGLEKAFNNLTTNYDIVGVLDKFNDFIKQLTEKAYLSKEYNNKRVNITKEKLSRDDIPISTIKTIEEVNYLDIELYNALNKQLSYR